MGMVYSAYENCRLCPRNCRVDRTAGEKGRCGETSTCRIASAGPHFGEEPSFSGTNGSGTLFFSGCSSRCFFCQNHQISMENLGTPFTPEELIRTALSLIGRHVHNLNFVTPDHFWPHIAFLCGELRARGETIPFLFNSSGYQRPDMIEEYARHIDIFMPDFKFADPELAHVCMGDARYPEIALASLRKMVELKGFLDPWDPTGRTTARQGVLVRHLVLPGHVENSLRVLKLLRAEFGQWLPLSVMSQFRPTPVCLRKKTLARSLSSDEYRQVCDSIRDLDLQYVFVQRLGDEDTEFLPDFSSKEPFAGNRVRKQCPGE